jgi:hypothetical protein
MTYAPHTFGKSKGAVNLIVTVQKLYSNHDATRILARASSMLSNYHAGIHFLANGMLVEKGQSFQAHMLGLWRNEYLKISGRDFPQQVDRFLRSMIIGQAREIIKEYQLHRCQLKAQRRKMYN